MTTTPFDGDFVKMLFNAKTKAEEEHRDRPFEWKPVIYESQIYNMKGFFEPSKFDVIDSWIRETWEVIDDSPYIDEQKAIWARIHERLDQALYHRQNMTYIAPQRRGKTWLGSQLEIIDEHLRMAEVRPVPNVRDLGYSIGPLHLDAEGRLRESINGSSQWRRNEESPAVQLQEWLQRRGICRRTLSCGIS